MPAKIVTVVKKVTVEFEVDGDPSDQEAIDTVKARMAQGAPIGQIGKPVEEIDGFNVREKGV